MNHLLTEQTSNDERAAEASKLTRVEQPHMEGEFYQIRSKPATISVFIGLLALLGFVFMIFMILAPAAILLAWVGLRTIRRYPEEYVGAGMAKIGLAFGLVALIGGAAFHTTIYLTEVREGYERISFYADLKNKVEVPTARSRELDGQKIFLKGYVRPGLRSSGLTEFLMVGDFGDCCFGGSPNLTEVVYVKMPENKTARYDFMLRRVHGTFRLNDRLQKGDRIANDVKGYIYEIHADYYD